VSWVESVPNISEGRRAAVVNRCVDAVRRTVSLLDATSDPVHNRSVLTFAGDPSAVHDAALALFAAAVPAIDLREHRGEHPRIGAVDVVPFVPLGSTTMHTCIDLARRVAAIVADQYDLPVFLYEQASRTGTPRRLEEIRRGGLASLTARMQTDEWRPDFGPRVPHPTAGVSVIGARAPLVAYNVELATDRLEVARAIARAVRESSGGLPALKAMGIPLADRGIVQVSMNLTDHRRTSIAQAFDAVASEARRLGVDVLGSELIGLAPEATLDADVAAHVRLRDFDASRMVLERRLEAVRDGR
jgi:glutamate formiminotransferase